MGEWAKVTLGSAPLEIIDGDRGSNYPSQKDFTAGGHCLFLNAGNVTTAGFNFSDCAFISAEKDAALRKGKLARHDIVLTTRGTVGNVAYFSEAVQYAHVRINSGMVIFRTRVQALDPRYLYMFLRSSMFHTQVRSLRTGSAQPQLPIRDINRVEIPLPPIRNQQAIAHILGTLDDKIELNRRMNRTLEKMAAAIFKSWFIDFDPVSAKADGRDPGLPAEVADLFPDTFEDSDLGPIPKGWNVGSLGDVADSPRRGVNPSDVPPTTPYIGLEHMPRRCIALDAWGRAEDVASGKSQFKQGEILFGKLRPYFHKVGIAPMDGVCLTDIVVVTPKSHDWHGYVLSLVSSKAFVDYTDTHSAGTKMPRTNWKDMSRYPLALSPLPLVKTFQCHVADFHRRIMLNVHQNFRLAGFRDTLLPKLLSGEIEMPAAEAAAEEVK